MTSRRASGQTRHRIVVTGRDQARAADLRCRLVDHGFDALLAVSETAVLELLRTATDACTVLYDVGASDARAWEVLMRLQRERPAPAVVVAAAEPASGHVDLCLLAGARTVVDAGGTDAALVAAVDGARRNDLTPADIAVRRRRALRHLARAGSAQRSVAQAGLDVPGDAEVRLTELERSTTVASADERKRQRFLALGPAQQALVAGLVRGESVQAIATARGVSTSAVYAARRRLLDRLDIRHDQVVEELRQRFGVLVNSGELDMSHRSQPFSHAGSRP